MLPLSKVGSDAAAESTGPGADSLPGRQHLGGGARDFVSTETSKQIKGLVRFIEAAAQPMKPRIIAAMP